VHVAFWHKADDMYFPVHGDLTSENISAQLYIIFGKWKKKMDKQKTAALQLVAPPPLQRPPFLQSPNLLNRTRTCVLMVMVVSHPQHQSRVLIQCALFKSSPSST